MEKQGPVSTRRTNRDTGSAFRRGQLEHSFRTLPREWAERSSCRCRCPRQDQVRHRGVSECLDIAAELAEADSDSQPGGLLLYRMADTCARWLAAND